MTYENNRLSAAQKHEVHMLLERVCTTFRAWDGRMYAKFADGWSDSKVAHHLSVQQRNVEYIRRQVFGDTRIPPRPDMGKPLVPIRQAAPAPMAAAAPPAIGPASNLAMQLTQRVKRLEELNDELTHRLDAIEDGVTKPNNGGFSGSAHRHK